MPQPLVERERELAVLEEALDGARAGRGGGVLLEGEAGIGKTALVDAAAQAARDRGLLTLTATGAPLDEGVAFGIVRRLLLPPLLDGDPQRLLRGAAALAGPALLDGDPEGPQRPDSAFATRQGLVWLVDALAEERGPLALVVDDVHWVDAASVRLLVALAERVGELPVALVASARPPAAWADPGLAAALGGVLRVLRPERLSEAGVAAALAGRLGSEPDAPFVTAAHAETAGTPYLVTALADAMQRAQVVPTADAVPRLRALGASEIGRQVSARVHDLDEEARAVCRAVAVLGDGARAEEAEAVAALPAGAAVRAAAALEAAGLVSGWPAPAFGHPLVRAAVLDELPADERARLHERAADLTAEAGEPERAALHLSETPARGRADRARLLHRVGLRALTSGAPETAARHLRRALGEPPSADDLGAVLFDLGSAELALADPGSPDRLRAAGEAARDPRLRLRALMVAGHALTLLGRWDEAFATMATAIDGAQDVSPEELFVARTERAAAMLTCIPTGREASRLLDELDGDVPRDSPVRGLVDGAIVLRNVTRARPQAELFALAASAATAPPPALGGAPLVGLPMIALVLADGFAQAETALSSALAGARRGLDITTVHVLSAWLSLALLRQGRLGEAEEAALAVAEGDVPVLPIAAIVAATTRATVALERGDLARAAREADQPYEAQPPLRDTNFIDDLRVVRARLRLARGEADAAARLLAEAAASQRRWGGESPTITQWRAHAAFAAAAQGRSEEARRHAEEEVAVAERFGGARPLATALRAQAAAVPERAERALGDALDAVAGSGADLEEARVRAALGGVLLRAGREDAARDVLRVALELAWRCEADALADEVRTLLVAAGARPRRPERTGVRVLTPAEARTARAAARGLSNREVAETLFLSEKTVETQLTAAYRKLGITGRGQLAAALGADREDAAAAP